MTTPGLDCGPYLWNLVMTDGSPIDPSVFTLDDAANPQELFVFTSDPVKAKTYQFTIQVTLVEYPENPGATKDFSVLIQDLCETSMDIIPAIAPPNQTYNVRSPEITYDPHNVFTADLASVPSFDWYYKCPWTYVSSITPTLATPDDTTIVYDPVSMSHTTYTENVNLTGTYSVKVTLVRPSGTLSTISFSYTITIIDPCLIATITLNPSPIQDASDVLRDPS